MQVAIVDISPEGSRHTGELSAALQDRLGQSLALPGRPLQGHFALTLQRALPSKLQASAAGRISVAGALDITGLLPCSGCLVPAQISLHVPLAVAVVPSEAEPAPLPGGELTAEAVELYTYEGEEVDLERLLHDEIIMALPQRTLCQPGCQGLCAGCGTNLNESTVPHTCGARRASGPFAALAQFRPKGPKPEGK